MGDPQNVDEARDAVKKILHALQVERVVCVDDTYESEPSLEDVIVSSYTLDANILREFLPEIGDSLSDDKDVMKEQIRRLWVALDQTTRKERAEKILSVARLQEGTGTDDLGDASILSELIPGEMLLALSPREWEERSGQLLKEDAEKRTLFLFDQDFSTSGGDVEGGIKIIASLLVRDDTENLICGLLTHTVTPENQSARWMELSEAYHIPRDRFLVVPKQHLSKEPVVFAHTLKLVALSPDFAELKQKTSKIIGDAASTAADHINAISIYDLDHIVFRISSEEGMWEPDMLFRLYALFQQLEARRLAHEGGELETIARRLRSVSHVPTETTLRPASSTWKIQQTELYESAEHLNKNHLPLELGDIFEKTDTESTKRYILLAQPCDLMVRNDGKRHPEIVHVPLAEVVPASEPPLHAEEMAYFDDNPKNRWYVKLKQIHQVHILLLDLCVFNDDGAATMQVDWEAPDAIRPAWKARYEILGRFVRRLLGRLDLLSTEEGEQQEMTRIKAKLRSELIGSLLNEGLFKGKLIDQSGRRGIAYNCRRIGRLSRARSFGLLMAYTGFLSRPAYDRAFGKSD